MIFSENIVCPRVGETKNSQYELTLMWSHCGVKFVCLTDMNMTKMYSEKLFRIHI